VKYTSSARGPPSLCCAAIRSRKRRGAEKTLFTFYSTCSYRRISSCDSSQQSGPDITGGRPSTSDFTSEFGGLTGKHTQEEFNTYMDAYVKRQKALDFLQPAQAPIATVPASRGPAPWMTCYSCGQKGSLVSRVHLHAPSSASTVLLISNFDFSFPHSYARLLECKFKSISRYSIRVDVWVRKNQSKRYDFAAVICKGSGANIPGKRIQPPTDGHYYLTYKGT
jgi:hypothetical protein